ncbi:MAG: TVP38/TMEM64 family protein, partial [Robiginitomaculum sp.]
MSFSRFITQLDKKAVRAIGVTLAMFTLVFAMIILGRHYLGVDESTLQNWFSAVNGSAWALPVTILVFVLAAFIGVPQWALIAGAVVAFGPAHGAAYSWAATMLSASVDFMIGRAIGAERVS